MTRLGRASNGTTTSLGWAHMGDGRLDSLGFSSRPAPLVRRLVRGAKDIGVGWDGKGVANTKKRAF